MTVHEGIKQFQCHKCDFKTGHKTRLREHNLYVHEKPHERPQCFLCNKEFESSYNLKKHVTIVHEKLKNFKCTYCEVAYGQKGDLNRHVKKVHNIDIKIESRNRRI